MGGASCAGTVTRSQKEEGTKETRRWSPGQKQTKKESVSSAQHITTPKKKDEKEYVTNRSSRFDPTTITYSLPSRERRKG